MKEEILVCSSGCQQLPGSVLEERLNSSRLEEAEIRPKVREELMSGVRNGRMLLEKG